MRIAHIVGTRPQLIKGRHISQAIKEAGHQEILLHTTQHYSKHMGDILDDMKVVRAEFDQDNITPIIRNSDYVIVEGDTESSLRGAVAANVYKIPIIHIEAGCRTFEDMPEEHIRHAVDHMSQYHLCAHENHKKNLEKEGIFNAQVVGDIQIWLAKNTELEPIPGDIFLTIHRQANAQRAFIERVLGVLQRTGRKIMFPAHPRISNFVQRHQRTDPMAHLDTLRHIAGCQVVVTDSGGIQKEAAALGKPVVVLRDKTEWDMLNVWLCPPSQVEERILPMMTRAWVYSDQKDVTKEFPQNPVEEMTKFFKSL